MKAIHIPKQTLYNPHTRGKNPHTHIVISPYNAPLTIGEEYIENLNEVLEIADKQLSELFLEYNPHSTGY